MCSVYDREIPEAKMTNNIVVTTTTTITTHNDIIQMFKNSLAENVCNMLAAI